MMTENINLLTNGGIKIEFTTYKVPFSNFLEKLNDGKYTITDEQKNRDIDDESRIISVWKVVKNFPINITECETPDGNIYIIQGYEDLVNIKEWMEKDISFNICGESVKFGNLQKDTQDFLRRRALNWTLIRLVPNGISFNTDWGKIAMMLGEIL